MAVNQKEQEDPVDSLLWYFVLLTLEIQTDDDDKKADVPCYDDKRLSLEVSDVVVLVVCIVNVVAAVGMGRHKEDAR